MSAYTFEVQNERPTVPSKSQHAALVDAAIATAGTTRSLIITPAPKEKADELSIKLRSVCCVRVAKLNKPLRVRSIVQNGKVYLWCESKTDAPRDDPAPETTTPTGALDETEKRVVKALELAEEEDGLGLTDIARSLYGRDADRKAPALRLVIAGLCQRKLLMQDGSLRYSLRKRA